MVVRRYGFYLQVIPLARVSTAITHSPKLPLVFLIQLYHGKTEKMFSISFIE